MADSFFCLIDSWLRLNETDFYLPYCFATAILLIENRLAITWLRLRSVPVAVKLFSKKQDPLAEHTALSWLSGVEAQIIRNLNP